MRASNRIYGPAAMATSDTLLYTSTAGDTGSAGTPATYTQTVIRRIHILNPTGSPVTFTLSIGADNAANRIYDAYSIPAGGVFDEFGPITLQPGETLRGHASSTSAGIFIDADLYRLG